VLLAKKEIKIYKTNPKIDKYIYIYTGCLRIGFWGEYLGLRGTKVTGEWRKLLNEELNDLCCSPNVVRVVKSRRMRWAEHVVRME